VFANALIMLREGFEAGLIVAILLAYLRKLERRDAFKQIWMGTGAAAAVATAVGAILFLTVGELTGDARKITFAIIMTLAAVVITWMVFWMRTQARAIKGDLQRRVDVALEAGTGALVGVAFVAVVREGVETALFFMAAAGQASNTDAFIGGAIGMAGALVLSYSVYAGSKWLNMRQFFSVSGALLLLIAAGLAARALSEFQVVGAIPTFWFPVFDVTSVDVLSTGSTFGQMLRGLFGWDPAPSIEEILIWAAYIGIVGTLYFRGLRPVARPAATAAQPAAPELSSAA
jgi:high-affinity iron transporter